MPSKKKKKSIIDRSFDWTVDWLVALGKRFNLTYNQINIIIWYIIIPFIFAVLIDILIKKTLFTPLIILIALCGVLIAKFFGIGKKMCDYIFDKSVVFLNLFRMFGLNYIAASVVICLIVPAIIILFLVLKIIFL